MLHEIDRPNIWHGNTLTGHVIYDGLFKDAPAQFDVILTNPPFGGKEGDDAQWHLRVPLPLFGNLTHSSFALAIRSRLSRARPVERRLDASIPPTSKCAQNCNNSPPTQPRQSTEILP